MFWAIRHDHTIIAFSTRIDFCQMTFISKRSHATFFCMTLSHRMREGTLIIIMIIKSLLTDQMFHAKKIGINWSCQRPTDFMNRNVPLLQLWPKSVLIKCCRIPLHVNQGSHGICLQRGCCCHQWESEDSFYRYQMVRLRKQGTGMTQSLSVTETGSPAVQSERVRASYRLNCAPQIHMLKP